MKVIRGGFGSRKAPAIGLVLGAGGVVGQAYQAGVLSALQRETGWDPRQAAVIVGTSAGSVTGAALRVGVRPWTWPPRSTGCPRRAGAAPSSVASSPPTSSRSRPRRSARCSDRGTFRPRRSSPGRPPAAGLPARCGGHDPAPPGPDRHLGAGPGPRRAHGQSLAGRTADLRGSPLGRGPGRLRPAARHHRLADAVLASCAIPGYFQPVDIGGTEYVDGGVHSATNADVLRSEELDVVVVISSMSPARGSVDGADGWIRRTVYWRMER